VVTEAGLRTTSSTRVQASVTSVTSVTSVLKCFFGIFFCTVAVRNAQAQSGATAFTNVTIIDGRSPAPRADRTVIIRGTRIVAEGPSASIRVPAGARIIDGRGKFLSPGLWDMHVHTAMPGGRDVLKLYIANGVTGVRDMAGDWPTITAWRREIASGALIGPRIIASGPYLEGGDQPIPHLLVKTPADAGPAVDSLIKLGVDFIKVHGQLTRESYFAIARAARTRRIPGKRVSNTSWPYRIRVQWPK
jgi:imidazolonepropionase-like amidohydrolase